MNDDLFLLLQQLDQLLLCTNITPNPPVEIIKITDNGGLFREMWERNI